MHKKYYPPNEDMNLYFSYNTNRFSNIQSYGDLCCMWTNSGLYIDRYVHSLFVIIQSWMFQQTLQRVSVLNTLRWIICKHE